jgi:O-antigen/teichoic acid export membrane protein
MSEAIPQVPDSQEPGEVSGQPSFLQAMLKQYTSLSKDILIYGLSGSLGQLISLVTVPILTRMLTVGKFGSVYLIYATVGYFSILMSFQIGAGLWRYYYEVPEDDLEDRQRMVSSLLWFVLGVGIPIAVLIASFGRQISIRLFDTPDNALAIQLAIIALPVMSVYNLFIGLQRLKRRPFVYLAISLGYSLLYFVLVATFIGVIKMGIQGIFLAQLLAYSCAGLVALWLGRELVALKFSRDWFAKMAGYGLPLIPGSILNWSLVAINRYYLNANGGVERVGYYSLATNIALAMSLVVSSFTLAWQPFMLANLKSPNARRLYVLTLNYYMMVTLMIGAGLAVFAREIVLIIGTSAYLPSVGLIGILVIRQILPGMDYITGVGIVIVKKTIYISIALGVGVLVILIGNLILSGRFGIYGAALSETCGVLASSVVVYIISNRLFPVRWNLRVVLLAVLGYAAVVLLSFALLGSGLSPGWMLLFKFLLLALYALYLMWLIGTEERKIIIGFLPAFIGMLKKRRSLPGTET